MADSDSTPLECTLDAAARLEAVLMTTDRPISDRRLTEAAGLDAGDSVGELVSSLNEIYESSGRVFRVVRVASGWQVMTLPEAAPVLLRLLDQRKQATLSPAAMETLSIIAYRQPVLRAEIEAIRGVA
ncbi:MAG: SMC-Scp complex subunit ScpB, partial [Phycisphaerales bacterium]|nr:SMC-Scp complex subunit ScpB [Phycisphaerales bacterium]